MPYRVLDASTAQAAPAVTLGAPLSGGEGTLLELRAALSREIAQRDDFSDPDLDAFLNWSYRQITGMLSLPELRDSFLVTLAVDQPFYALPTGVAWVRNVAVTDTSSVYGGRELTMIDEEMYRRLPDSAGSPKHYFQFNRMLVLYPDPDSIRSAAVDVQVRPQPLSEDTHVPLLPVELHEALILGARSRAERVARMTQESHSSWNMMLSLLRPMLDPEAESRTNMQARMQPARTHRDLYRAGGREHLR